MNYFLTYVNITIMLFQDSLGDISLSYVKQYVGGRCYLLRGCSPPRGHVKCWKWYRLAGRIHLLFKDGLDS